MRFTIPLFALAAFASAVPVFEAEAVPENDAAAEPKNIAERAPPAYWIISGTRKYTTAGWTEEITSLFYSDKYTTGFPATCTRKYLTGIGGEPSCIPNHFHYWLDRTQDVITIQQRVTLPSDLIIKGYADVTIRKPNSGIEVFNVQVPVTEQHPYSPTN